MTRQANQTSFDINMLYTRVYKFSTHFPQILWKTIYLSAVGF